MSNAGDNEQEVFSVARTLDFSGAENGDQDIMNVVDALDLDPSMAGKGSAALNGKINNTHRNYEEGSEEKGDEKHVISHGGQDGAENGEHLTATSLREDEFQKLLLLAEEFEADEGVKTEGDVEETGKVEGEIGVKEEAVSRDQRDGKVKGGDQQASKTGATANRKGPTPTTRVSKVRPSSAPTTSMKNGSKTETDGTPKRKRHGEGAVEGESRPLSVTPAVVTRLTNGVQSRTKLTIPQPFALATDKRASLGGRVSDGESAVRNAPVMKKAPVKVPSKSAAPTKPEVSKRYQESTGKVKSAPVSSSDEEVRQGATTYPALKIKANQPTTSASSFQFKCDERAEKRREYYNKLGERLSAKEAEKTQIEAKTQEEAEAKIRELRKSLTFKANPMPTFYQEAPPPKVEIKKIPTTRAKSPKLGTSRRSSLAGAGFGSDAEVVSSRVSRSGRPDPDHKSNGHSDDNKDISALKKAIKKPSIAKPLTDKVSRSSKSNGRLENSKSQLGAVSGTSEITDAKDDSIETIAPDLAVHNEEAKTSSGDADIIEDVKDDAAAPVGESVTSDASNGTDEKVDGGNGTVEKSDGNAGISEKVSRPARSTPVSEEVKEKVVKAKREKLKASTPILSSAAKREAAIKNGAKNNADIVPSISDVAVAS